jgi:hypothetical protein
MFCLEFFAFVEKVLGVQKNLSIRLTGMTLDAALSSPRQDKPTSSGSSSNTSGHLSSDQPDTVLTFCHQAVLTKSLLTPGTTYYDESVYWTGGHVYPSGRKVSSKNLTHSLTLAPTWSLF